MSAYLATVRKEFARYRSLAEKAVAQVPDDARLQAALDPESNSVAVLLRHVGGNLASRWTDFLTSDGEKPDRDRDAEFEARPLGRAEILGLWERGWTALETALASLKENDLARTVTIRGEPHTVLQAVERSLGHTCYHVGQIVFLCKHLASERWTTLSIARGQSKQFRPP